LGSVGFEFFVGDFQGIFEAFYEFKTIP